MFKSFTVFMLIDHSLSNLKAPSDIDEAADDVGDRRGVGRTALIRLWRYAAHARANISCYCLHGAETSHSPAKYRLLTSPSHYRLHFRWRARCFGRSVQKSQLLSTNIEKVVLCVDLLLVLSYNLQIFYKQFLNSRKISNMKM
ncbi:hypothetical protein CDAR_84841 [Caerostris darwini]|uniref:Uncharacterized protein n=1 Tax=Caerostris darwini TaxID=1538125 RepID=A0AAV4X283_9ARAC|nr:hypothetical protein CDAR_84841 [Caerostris darwini]